MGTVAFKGLPDRTNRPDGSGARLEWFQDPSCSISDRGVVNRTARERFHVRYSCLDKKISGDGWFNMKGMPSFLEGNKKFARKTWKGAYQKMLNVNKTEFALLNYIQQNNGEQRWDLDYWFVNNDGNWDYQMLYHSASSSYDKFTIQNLYNKKLRPGYAVVWDFVPYSYNPSHKFQGRELGEVSDDCWTYAGHSKCLIKNFREE